MTYDETVDMWARFRMAMNEVRPGTVKMGKRNAKHLSPYIGGKQLDDIKTIDVENALILIKSEGNLLAAGTPMADATVRKIHGAGMKCFQWAIDRELCSTERNPFKKASRPKAGKSVKPHALQPEDAKRLSQFSKKTLECDMEAPITTRRKIRESAICAAVLIALGTGMRRGEICALDWENVGDRNIAVVKALKNEGTIEEPKNNTSRRNVAIGRELHEILDEYRAWQERAGVFTAIDGGHPVLMLNNSKRMSGNVFEHYWARFREDAGFPGLRFHDLRHTHATMLIAAGVDVKTVQMRMGHSSAVMTLDVYAHAVPRNDADAASEISGELFT